MVLVGREDVASDGADVNVRDGVGIREGDFEVIEYVKCSVVTRFGYVAVAVKNVIPVCVLPL